MELVSGGSGWRRVDVQLRPVVPLLVDTFGTEMFTKVILIESISFSGIDYAKMFFSHVRNLLAVSWLTLCCISI